MGREVTIIRDTDILPAQGFFSLLMEVVRE